MATELGTLVAALRAVYAGREVKMRRLGTPARTSIFSILPSLS